jgi:hypothetical protein
MHRITKAIVQQQKGNIEMKAQKEIPSVLAISSRITVTAPRISRRNKDADFAGVYHDNGDGLTLIVLSAPPVISRVPV